MKGFLHPYGLSLAFLSVAGSEVEYKSLDGPRQMFPRASVLEGIRREFSEILSGSQFRNTMHFGTSQLRWGVHWVF